MYGKLGTTLTTAGGTTALAYTGVSVIWEAVAGLSLLAAGFAIVRLLPRASR